MSTLQEQIEARKREASEKKVDEKAEAVARHLGTDQKPSRGVYYVFEDSRFKITFAKEAERHDEDWPSTGTTVIVDGECVYSWSGESKLDERAAFAGIIGLTCYIPGEWEKHLDALAQLADGRKVAKEQLDALAAVAMKAREEDRERKKWGL